MIYQLVSFRQNLVQVLAFNTRAMQGSLLIVVLLHSFSFFVVFCLAFKVYSYFPAREQTFKSIFIGNFPVSWCSAEVSLEMSPA